MKNVVIVALLLLCSVSLFTQINPITVTSPNGGENWVAGSMHPITWNYTNLEGNVRIELISPMMNPAANIVAEVPVSSRTFNWVIPNTIAPASFYQICISKISSNGVIVSDLSDASFTISGNANVPAITVTSPNGGENWQTGNTYPIAWNYSNLTGNVQILLETPYPTFAPVVIATEVPVEGGIFNWTIPASILPMEGYRISVTWLSILAVFIGDTSDGEFTISGGDVVPSITVVTPNGGENWVKGTVHPITWNSQGLEGNVQIGLVRNNNINSGVLVIARNVPNTGFMNWRIPLRIPNGAAYKIVIRSRANNAVIDYSDAPFTISGSNIIPFYVTPVMKTSDGQVSFSITSDTEKPLSAEIYNIKGQLVKKLTYNELTTGKKTLFWNGVTNSGKTSNNGIYFLKVRSGNEVLTKKFKY